MTKSRRPEPPFQMPRLLCILKHMDSRLAEFEKDNKSKSTEAHTPDLKQKPASIMNMKSHYNLIFCLIHLFEGKKDISYTKLKS